MTNLTKLTLIAQVAERTGLQKVQVGAVLDEALAVIVATTDAGHDVSIKAFGAFERRSRGARVGRDPQTGEAIEIRASSTLAFRASPALRREA
ncbi:HU family DNA-binding protein [Neomegalonema sp.]|uniref:HU family DNA-binding protein n=1 Tax=Neomegalonema sp. TaxID=2039713 RepID=UPI002630F544|nr:HU family DNA-binding protein [Neomegalonema sp.]MDD2870115.1 HU family DNA-binding protein [Neomegalonema sp.]